MGAETPGEGAKGRSGQKKGDGGQFGAVHEADGVEDGEAGKGELVPLGLGPPKLLWVA